MQIYNLFSIIQKIHQKDGFFIFILEFIVHQMVDLRNHHIMNILYKN